MYLLRIALPDRPGVLGAVASSLGRAGVDIATVAVVERRDGVAIDDFIVELPAGHSADQLVSASQAVDGVEVEWVSRYAAGGDLIRDLEAVEAMTTDPPMAAHLLTELAPGVFMAQWAMLATAPRVPEETPTVITATKTAPDLPEPAVDCPWDGLDRAARVTVSHAWQEAGWTDVVAGAPIGGGTRVLLVGRSGGPAVLDSELARLGHLAALADTIAGRDSDI